MAGIGFSLTIKGAEKLYKALSKETVLSPLGQGIKKITLFLDRETKMATPVDTGELRASITSQLTAEFGKVGTNVNYACIVGSRQQVYEPREGISANIGSYPYQAVLSKDGQAHDIEARHRFSKEPIDCVSIKAREGRNPLVVTADHLILVLRKGKVIWETAHNLRADDMIFGKRSHNAVTDNSNKEPYLCFCGAIFWVEQSILSFRQPKYCSLECRHKYGTHAQNTGMTWTLSEEQREKHRGENNASWRDGSAMKPYDYNFNGQLKVMVKERDGLQCQQCSIPFNLLVHHRDWNKMNSNIENQDCELPEVNLDVFVPRKILELQKLEIAKSRKGGQMPLLYDFTIKDENSFMVGGILVHNSFVEYGTKPHIIMPKRAKALHFMVGGQEVFAKSVRHPGTKARHVEGGKRVYGVGMFAYAMSKLQAQIGEFLKGISEAIQVKWGGR